MLQELFVFVRFYCLGSIKSLAVKMWNRLRHGRGDILGAKLLREMELKED